MRGNVVSMASTAIQMLQLGKTGHDFRKVSATKPQILKPQGCSARVPCQAHQGFRSQHKWVISVYTGVLTSSEPPLSEMGEIREKNDNSDVMDGRLAHR